MNVGLLIHYVTMVLNTLSYVSDLDKNAFHESVQSRIQVKLRIMKDSFDLMCLQRRYADGNKRLMILNAVYYNTRTSEK